MTERQPIIAGNWKMYKTREEAISFIQELAPKVKEADVAIYLAVPFTDIFDAAKEAEETPIIIGAQNMSDATKGAFTGEVASDMLKSAGASFVLLGHSERRHIFGETDDFINRKVRRALEEDIQPFLCIGETEDQREKKQTEDILKNQIKSGLAAVTAEDAIKVVIAYEPVWAIGTGKTATPEIAQQAHAFIRSCLSEIFSKDIADKIRIIYGGSVKPGNISQLMEQEDIDGALVGGASLDASSFSQIVNYSKG